VIEALKALEGNEEPGSLIQKSLAIAGIALEMSGKAAAGTGFNVAGELLRNGKALEKLRQIIEIQGGDPKVTSSDIVPGKYEFVVKSQTTGYVTDFNNKSLITIARLAGAPQNAGAGVLLHAKKGNKMQAGDPIFTIYAERKWQLEKAVEEGRRLMPVVIEGMLIDRVPGDNKWQ
jgi:AMP phosphorylase